MTHIATLMMEPIPTIGLNNSITKDAAEHLPNGDKDKHVWRMHQFAERKYQFFPSKSKEEVEIAGCRSFNTEPVLKIASPTPTSSPEKGPGGGNSKIKAKDQQTLVRRRKVSVPELGPTPMTTVQEVAMDSPTIPGRPPYERSTSAPGNSWRQHMFGESMLLCISGPALDESVELNLGHSENVQADVTSDRQTPISKFAQSKSTSTLQRQALSTKVLAPLVIPSNTSAAPQRLVRHTSLTKSKNHFINPPDVPPKSARWLENSPYSRPSPLTPTCTAVSTAPTSIATPRSAPEGPAITKPWVSTSARSSPTSKPWVVSLSGRMSPKQITITGTGRSSPLQTSTTGDRTPPKISNPMVSPLTVSSEAIQNNTHAHPHPDSKLTSHRRHESENSIMDRARPKKRSESAYSFTNTTPAAPPNTGPSPIKRSSSTKLQRPPSKLKVNNASPVSSTVELIREFETLPTGIPPQSASTLLSPTEISTLHTQALSQATRFEVLPSTSVASLSEEVRGLDERCEYLRKTHHSLRAGRRNLHKGICSYLRGRTAKFSHEALLKQEEAMSELDRSIDNSICKLEQAENRRMRVRQKLLEHVAGALILSPNAQQPSLAMISRLGESCIDPRSSVQQQQQQQVAAAPGLLRKSQSAEGISCSSILSYSSSNPKLRPQESPRKAAPQENLPTTTLASFPTVPSINASLSEELRPGISSSKQNDLSIPLSDHHSQYDVGSPILAHSPGRTDVESIHIYFADANAKSSPSKSLATQPTSSTFSSSSSDRGSLNLSLRSDVFSALLADVEAEIRRLGGDEGLEVDREFEKEKEEEKVEMKVKEGIGLQGSPVIIETAAVARGDGGSRNLEDTVHTVALAREVGRGVVGARVKIQTAVGCF